MSECSLSELGVSVTYSKEFQTKLGNQWHCAKKLSTPRLFSLLALSQLVEEFRGIGMTALSCVDALPGVGIAGILWKKYCGEYVKVTVNAADGLTKKSLEDGLNNNSTEANVVCEDPNALLHSDTKYNMIYLEAYGSTVRYLEAACHALCHRGVLCIVSTDLCTLYNKCPERVQRIYHGHAMKHEYGKELAVRLILANVARAASRWDRGISVLSTYVDEISITLIVRVLKGASHANKSLDCIQRVAHCRVCHYRRVLNEKLYYTPMPDITNCFCVDGGYINGDALPPIVMLGPAYIGSIFDTNFIIEMAKSLKRFDVQCKLATPLLNMALESLCFDSNEKESEFCIIYKQILKTETNPNDEPSSKRLKEDLSEQSVQDCLSSLYKNDSDYPAFFYNVQTHTKKGSNPPRIQFALERLRSKGFRACTTLFDTKGIRTSASPTKFREIINSKSSDST